MQIMKLYCDICGIETKTLRKLTIEFAFSFRTFHCCPKCIRAVRRLVYRDLWCNKITDTCSDMVERERLCDDTQSIPRHALSDN